MRSLLTADGKCGLGKYHFAPKSAYLLIPFFLVWVRMGSKRVNMERGIRDQWDLPMPPHNRGTQQSETESGKWRCVL